MEINKFKQYEEEAYKTVYAEPEETFHRKLIPKMVADFIPQFNLKHDDVVFDIGCGPGVFLQEMKDLHYTNVTGFTLSKEDYEICISKGLNCKMESMSDIDYEDGTVDFIWCRHSLEHSPYPLFTLFEFNRLMREGGKAYIEVPAPDCDRPHESNPNHYSILGNAMWSNLFIKAGFKILFANYFEFTINDSASNKEAKEKYIIYGIEKCTQLFPNMN